MRDLVVGWFLMASAAAPALGDLGRGGDIYGVSCVRCHGSDGQGRQEWATPKMAGQHDWYIVDALNDFRDGNREDEADAHKGISGQDALDLAAYIAALVPSGEDS